MFSKVGSILTSLILKFGKLCQILGNILAKKIGRIWPTVIWEIWNNFWQIWSMSNVECRMSRMVRKTPWTLSKVPSAPIWCSPVRKKRKRKRKMKGNQICEKITAQTEDSLITYCLSRKRALCATCKKSDPAETNLSRASRVRQDSQFHTVDKGGILFEWKILYRARILRSGVAVDLGEQESC